MTWELLFLLLPIAATSGWWLGWRSANKKQLNTRMVLPQAYYKGLNYLINEQPDRATEVFLKMLDVDSETIEVHYALASLFLKRGEVDRAIRIHQNLIARPTLTRDQRHETLFYLAQDYLRAGVLDRAEGVFSELCSDTDYGQESLKSLLNIYQQQQEWEKAIEIARRLQKKDRVKYAECIANYYCELALSLPSHSVQQKRAIKQAVSSDRNCARATILEAQALMNSGKFLHALKSFKKVEQQDASLLVEVLPQMLVCWEGAGTLKKAVTYLESVMSSNPSVEVLYHYAEVGQRLDLEGDFNIKLRRFVMDYPSLRGVLYLFQLEDGASALDGSDLSALLQKADAKALHYRCAHCGFKGNVLHWQCPGCQSWNRIRRINDLEFPPLLEKV